MRAPGCRSSGAAGTTPTATAGWSRPGRAGQLPRRRQHPVPGAAARRLGGDERRGRRAERRRERRRGRRHPRQRAGARGERGRHEVGPDPRAGGRRRGQLPHLDPVLRRRHPDDRRGIDGTGRGAAVTGPRGGRRWHRHRAGARGGRRHGDDPPKPRAPGPGGRHGPPGLGPQARLGAGRARRAGARRGCRRPHRGGPGRPRHQHHARQRRVGPARPPGERDAGAPVRRRRQPRAAHPAGLDPRLRRAHPPRDRPRAAHRHPRHRPGGVRGAADAGARRGPAAARPARLGPAAATGSRSTCRCSP